MYQSFETYSPMPPIDELTQRARLAQLKEEHRDLDAAIAAMESGPIIDYLGIQRLKKRKLSLRDQIGSIENSLIPDIIA